ncbi:unnamed protein product [Meloidogyne enterolobii]|nr:unnamed protein product [Meloidogyne enterolobii]
MAMVDGADGVVAVVGAGDEEWEAGAATEWEDGDGDVEKLKYFLELIENKYFILNFELL